MSLQNRNEQDKNFFIDSSVPDGGQQLEVGRSKACFHCVQVVDKTGEEPKEWLLLEHDPLIFMHVGQHEDEDRQDFSEVVHLGLVIVDTRSIPVVLDDVDDQARHRIQSLESIIKLSSCDALEVAVDAGIGADAEEERGDVLDLQDTLLSKLGDVRYKSLLWGVRTLEDSDPLLEPREKLLPELLSLRFDRRLPDNDPIGTDGVARASYYTTEVIK